MERWVFHQDKAAANRVKILAKANDDDGGGGERV